MSMAQTINFPQSNTNSLMLTKMYNMKVRRYCYALCTILFKLDIKNLNNVNYKKKNVMKIIKESEIIEKNLALHVGPLRLFPSNTGFS